MALGCGCEVDVETLLTTFDAPDIMWDMEKSKDNSRIVVTLEKRQRKALEKIQKDTGASFAFLIRRAIDKYLDGIKK